MCSIAQRLNFASKATNSFIGICPARSVLILFAKVLSPPRFLLVIGVGKIINCFPAEFYACATIKYKLCLKAFSFSKSSS